MSAREIQAPAGWGDGAVRGLTRTCLACAGVLVIGLFADAHASWTGFLFGFHALVGLAVAGPVGLAFLHLSGGRWSRSLEVVPRAMGSALPAAAVAGLVLLFGASSLFEWTHADAVAADPILQQKSGYLNLPFFGVRLVLFFGLWIWLGGRVMRGSAAGAGYAVAPARKSMLRTAAVFLLVFAPTWSLASIDWLQSLEPHWFSSIYALGTLAGAALSGLAAAIVLIAALDVRGRVSASQYGDLGALLLSLALFWGYIWYCQYMLVWYTNLPEETPWYAARLGGAWGTLTKTACVLCSALPFVLLLFRRLRRSRVALVRIAVVVLVGRVVDLIVLAGPPLLGETPAVGLFELAGIAGAIALFFLFAIRALARTAPDSTSFAGGASAAPAVPAREPAGSAA